MELIKHNELINPLLLPCDGIFKRSRDSIGEARLSSLYSLFNIQGNNIRQYSVVWGSDGMGQ